MPKRRKMRLKNQLDMLQKLFLKANIDPLKEDPLVELKKIDWKIVSESLTLAEKLHALKDKYPDYNWDLYASIDEMFADEFSHVFDVEVKPFERTVKGRIYRYGRIQVALPEALVGRKVRIAFVESLEDYIKYWTGRRRGQEMLGLDDWV